MKELLNRLESLISAGNAKQAQRELSGLRRRRVPRELALVAAGVARRASLPSLAVRILNPIVRPSRKSPVSATSEEVSEYAACLIRIGAVEEAKGLLESLSASGDPSILLYRAFAHITRWEYGDAIPLLEKYLASSVLGEYQRCVGKANLVASLVFEGRNIEAEPLIEALLEDTEQNRYWLLHGNTLELAAQSFMKEKRFEEARRCLDLAQERLKGTTFLDEFFLHKWRAILELSRQGANRSTLAALRRIRTEAILRGHWETVRDCDRYEAKFTLDRGLFAHVYFGTPFENFRKKMAKDAGKLPELGPHYDWRLGKGKRESPVLDLRRGSWGKRAMKLGQVPHRLTLALSSDFYRPSRIAHLHFLLYPREYFNPVTSPLRVHQALWELRRWLDEHRCPLVVEEANEFYRLGAKGPCSVRISRTEGTVGRSDLLLSALRAKVSSKFSVSEAALALGTTTRTALRLLVDGLEGGRLVREGKGVATRYSFVRAGTV